MTRIFTMPGASMLRRLPVLDTLAAIALALAAILAGALPAPAHEFKAGDLEIDHPWTRATPGGASVAGGFMIIKNEGAEADRLVGGTAGFAGTVEVHEMKVENDVMTMRKLDAGLEIPAGGTVKLAPGSYHIMFIGLSQPLVEGEKVKGTLTFEKAGTVDVEWAVEAMGANPHGEHGAGHDAGAEGGDAHQHHNHSN